MAAGVAGWSDPLYRRRDELPSGVARHRFAGVEAAVTVTDTDPAELSAMWSHDRDVALVVTDTVGVDELTAALPEFLELAGTLVAHGETAATITLPSRDVDRCAAVRAAGFAPSGVLAIAPLERSAPNGADRADDLRVRDVVAADAAALAALWWEQACYEARVGTLRTSPAIRAAVDAAAVERAAGRGIGLVVETGDGRLVGVILADAAADSGWAGGRVSLEPVSYLFLASTTAASRGRGVGALAVRELHRRHRAAGIAASLLHYGPNNPLSVPFWSQQGYRPLLTTFSQTVAGGSAAT